MHKVTKIITDDGTCFDTDKEARKYLDRKYGDCLTSLVHKMLQQDKYVALCEFVDTNLDLFQELISLKNEHNEEVECCE